MMFHSLKIISKKEIFFSTFAADLGNL